MRPACADLSALFFSEQAEDLAYAKRLCAACPLRRPCAARALTLRPKAGVWAGVLLGKRGPGHKKLRAIAGDLYVKPAPPPPRRTIVVGTHHVDAIDTIPSDRRRVYRHQRDFSVRSIA